MLQVSNSGKTNLKNVTVRPLPEIDVQISIPSPFLSFGTFQKGFEIFIFFFQKN